MERSYAYGKRFGYKRARWRALWRVSIQQLLVATVQNLKKYPNMGNWKAKQRAWLYSRVIDWDFYGETLFIGSRQLLSL